MPSAGANAVKQMYATWTTARLNNENLDTESWGHLTAEPGAVDYIETDASGVPAMWIVPKNSTSDRVILYMHGGGFVGGSIYTHRKLAGHLAKAAGTRALLFNYRLTPAHTHPAQVDDATTTYRWLLNQGIQPAHIAFAGDSAGGGLALTAQVRAREQGLPLPAAALLLSPWVDMELTAGSFESNRDKDAFFYREMVEGLVAMFLGTEGNPRDPLANPLYADLSGLGPVYIQVAGDETLLDESRMLEKLLGEAGVEVKLDVFPEMQHTFQMAAGKAPEADEAIGKLAGWVRPRLALD